MGTAFKYVADAALIPDRYRPFCDVCGRRGLVYEVCCDAFFDDSATYQSVDVACAGCCKAGKLRALGADVWAVETVVRDYLGAFARGVSATEVEERARILLWSLNRTPCRLPQFLRGIDWPLCCGDWTEFVGKPDRDEALVALQSLRLWDRGPRGTNGRPISLRVFPRHQLGDASVFRCLTCAQPYLVYQST
jgi:hypothetical protein